MNVNDQWPPLAEVRRELRVEWYRCPIAPAKLRELMRRSDRKGWFQAGGHLGLFACTAALVILCWSQQLWVWFALALFAHGTIGTFFRGLATHELSHKTVFRTKWLNKLFLYVYALPSWDNPFHYAVSHTYHHRYTLHPEGDREAVLPANVSLRFLRLLQLFTFNVWRSRRNLGAGGLLPILLDTVEAAFGVVGGEWWTAMYAGQPQEKRKAIWWAARNPGVSRRHCRGGDRDRAVGAAGGAVAVSVHRQLVGALRRPADARRPARQRDRLSQMRALDHPGPVLGVHLLAT